MAALTYLSSMVHALNSSPSVLNRFLAEIRDADIQKDPLRFRRNLERIGELAAVEISRTFDYTNSEVNTPLGLAQVALNKEELVVATILRAGLPLQTGVLNIFDRAGSAFVSAYRKYTKGEAFDIHVEYISCPRLTGKVLILTDPMIATGRSMISAYKGLLAKGTPDSIHVVSAIASKEGLNYVRQHMPQDTHIWVGAVDDELTAKAYIVPGLGDAGDLAFGPKED